MPITFPFEPNGGLLFPFGQRCPQNEQNTTLLAAFTTQSPLVYLDLRIRCSAIPRPTPSKRMGRFTFDSFMRWFSPVISREYEIMGNAMLSVSFKSKLAVSLAFAMSIAALSSTALHAEVLLTVEKPGAETVTFTREDLAEMERISFKTSTLWTEGVREFSGVPLKAILDASGITSGVVRAVAVNDYLVEIPVETLDPAAPIVADQIDGKGFSRREKGPLWIIYPFDSSESYKTEENYGRSVWQLVRLTGQ
jgi:hypothetical protein